MSNQEMLPLVEIERLVLEGVLYARVEDYEDAAKIFAAHLPELASSENDDKKIISASAFSYYGLCVAKLDKKYSEAIEYCQISIRVQPHNPEHYENLGKIYLLMRNRKKAVEAFQEGLQREPGNVAIKRALNRIGQRGEPVIGFLSRDFPLNIWLGRKRHEKKMRRRSDALRAKKAKLSSERTSAADIRIKHAQTRADQHRAKRKDQTRKKQ